MPQPETLAEHVLDVLAGHGVQRIFGIPGGGSSLALIKAASGFGIDFVLARTETAAALMAAVTGELTGTPGVVLTGIGPGAASAVNGIAYAHLERAPLVLFTDGPASSLHQGFDQNALFAPITKSQGRLRPEHGRRDVEAAVLTAIAPPWGPVQLNLTAADALAPVSAGRSTISSARAVDPEPGALERAASLLASSQRPLLIAGLEARYGKNPAALRALVDVLACPVMLSYKAKGVLPETDPAAVGLFTGAAGEANCLRQADLIVFFGFDPVEMIPGDWPHGAAAPILDLRQAAGPALPGGAECQVSGDLAATVADLRGRLSGSAWTKGEVVALRAALGKALALEGVGHTAQNVMESLSQMAPFGCRLAVDAGAHMFSAMALWQAEAPFGVLKSNGLSTMGYALPAALASALQEPERPVLAVTGDAGLMMCLAELTTAVERQCLIVVVVLNDAALSLIDIKQQRQQHLSRGVRYRRVDFAAAARALGCRAWRLEAEDALEAVVEAAFAGDGPAVIDITVDPSGYREQLAALRG
jgi:acetolactate synthase-1/2/3 large subunit